MEACSQEEAEAGVAALLAAFPAIPCPPGQPWRLQRSAWGSDPLFRGSYSYVNARGSPADIDTLAQPLTVCAPALTASHTLPSVLPGMVHPH